ncbi:hypothetical protein HDV05_000319 [Chytridiales sp. JEL 0842]|nr:hypothetical protein HDV05_000319 [Chytridiales sp. JEL 0842]
MKLISASIVLALAAVVAAQSIPDALTSKGDASTLLSLVAAQPAILDALTSTTGPITVFAPVDSAFQKILAAGFNASNTALVADVLQYHVVAGTTFIPDEKTPARLFVDTLLKNPLNFDGPTDLRVDFDKKDVTLTFGLDAPAKVIGSANILNGNGIIHYIDTVLTPPADLATTAAKVPDLKSLLDTLVAVELANPVNALKGITVLAPTNKAFEDIAPIIPTLTTEQIKAVLAYHILPGVVYSTQIPAALNNVGTYNQGQTLNVTSDDHGVAFQGFGNEGKPAKVALADVLVANGVVHVIDRVLIPDLTKPLAPLAQILPSSADQTTPATTPTATDYNAGATPKATSTLQVSSGNKMVGGMTAAFVGAAAAAALFY